MPKYFEIDSAGKVSFRDHASGTSVPVYSKKMGERLVENYVLPEDKEAAEIQLTGANLPEETEENLLEAEEECMSKLKEERDSREIDNKNLEGVRLGLTGFGEKKKL